MITSISENLARQILETIHDVCGYDINIISPNGRICASTNPERIGTYHEIGARAARTGKTLEVRENTDFAGSRKGINIPIYYHGAVIAVVGITAEPEEARRYAHLAERVATMLLHEQEMSEYHRNLDEQKRYVMQCLKTGSYDNYDYFKACLDTFRLDPEAKYRMLCIEVHARYNPVNISMLEQRIGDLLESMGQKLYTYSYPNQFSGVIGAEIFEKNRFRFEKFASSHHPVLKIAVGSVSDIPRCPESWQNALTALESVRDQKDQDMILFDRLDLEILFAGMNRRNRTEFREKIMKNVSREEADFLKQYYEEDMSLKKTSEKLYLHKNTVQQRLNRIEKRTGKNPRKFRDAVLFYLAGKL